MTFQDLGSIGEFLAAIATLLTLVYLAAQIRQNTRAIKATSFMASQHSVAGVHDYLAQNPDLLELADRAFDPTRPRSDYSDKELLRLGVLGRAMTQRTEAQYYLHKSGFLESDFWEMRRSWLRGWLDLPVWEEWWASERSQGMFSQAFIEDIESAAPTTLKSASAIERPPREAD